MASSKKLLTNKKVTGCKPACKKTSVEDLAEWGYTIGRILGEGSYCKVRAATFRGEELAVKIICRDKMPEDIQTKFLPRELEILTEVKHPNILHVYKIFVYPRRTFIFMEHIQRGNLLQIMRDRGRLMEFEAHNYFKQMTSAILYLHNSNLAHRDLKCENIMINENDEVKIIDFGFCARPGTKKKSVSVLMMSDNCWKYDSSWVNEEGRRMLSHTFCGSAAYAAPEVIQGIPYNPMMYDVWSLGCVLYIMMAGKMPFDSSNIKKMVTCQMKKVLKYPTNFTVMKPIKSLISWMLEPDVTKRANMKQVSQCLWVKQRRRVSKTTQTYIVCAYGNLHFSTCCCSFNFDNKDGITKDFT